MKQNRRTFISTASASVLATACPAPLVAMPQNKHMVDFIEFCRLRFERMKANGELSPEAIDALEGAFP